MRSDMHEDPTLRKLLNLFPRLILSSPLHRLMSERFMLIGWRGRRTGRTYSTPVAYLRSGDEVLLTTDDRWWHFVDGRPVSLRIRGATLVGVATAVTEPEAVTDAVETLIDAQPSYARLAGIRSEGSRPTRTDVRRSVDDGRVLLRVSLNQPGAQG